MLEVLGKCREWRMYLTGLGGMAKGLPTEAQSGGSGPGGYGAISELGSSLAWGTLSLHSSPSFIPLTRGHQVARPCVQSWVQSLVTPLKNLKKERKEKRW